eukprot:1346127-Heterocapsa_arctica.AAC.1
MRCSAVGSSIGALLNGPNFLARMKPAWIGTRNAGTGCRLQHAILAVCVPERRPRIALDLGVPMSILLDQRATN